MVSGARPEFLDAFLVGETRDGRRGQYCCSFCDWFLAPRTLARTGGLITDPTVDASRPSPHQGADVVFMEATALPGPLSELRELWVECHDIRVLAPKSFSDLPPPKFFSPGEVST